MRDAAKKLIPVVALAVPILVLFFPVLFAGKIFSDGDVTLYHYPLLSVYHAALRAGTSFSYLPEILGGFPLDASLLGGLWNPVNLLFFRFLPTELAYNILTVAGLFAGGIATYALARKLALSVAASLVAMFGFTFSGWVMHWVGTLPMTNSFFLLPLLALFLFKIEESVQWKRWLWMFLGGGILGWAWLSGFPQLIFYALVFLGTLAIFLDWRRGARRPAEFRLTGSFLLLGLVGFALGSRQLFSWLIAFKESARTTISFAAARSEGLGPLDVLNFFLPNLHIPFLNRGANIFLGFLPVFFAVLGWKAAHPLKPFLRGWAIVVTLFLVPFSPLLWLSLHLPAFSGFRDPVRWMFIGSLVVSLLAGLGFDRLFAERLSLRRALTWWGGAILVIVAGLLIVGGLLRLFSASLRESLVTYFLAHRYQASAHLPLSYYREVIAQGLAELRTLLSPRNLPLLGAVFSSGAGLGLLFFWKAGKIGKAGLQWGLLGILFFLPFSLYGGAYHFVEKEFIRREYPIAAFLKSAEPDVKKIRVFSFLPGFTLYSRFTALWGANPREEIAFKYGMLAPNANVAQGIPSIDGYENLMPRGTAELLARLGSERATAGERLALERIPPEEKAKKLLERLPLLRAMGVRYLISAIPLVHPELREVYRATVTSTQIPVFVYRL